MDDTYKIYPWFDGHVHLRGSRGWGYGGFRTIVEATAFQCRYAVVMPNSPVIKTVDEMIKYRRLIRNSAKKYPWFEPLMTLYLTADTPSSEIVKAAQFEWFAGFKLYPEGVTTGSEGGVRDFSKLGRVLEDIDAVGGRLLIHAEMSGVDPLCAERAFIEGPMVQIRERFKGLICIEHCSTAQAVQFVLDHDRTYGSITAHHLNGTFKEMIDNPFNRCKPVWQTEENRQVLIKVLKMENQRKFYAGTDSAPHPTPAKMSNNPPNGCYTAPIAVALYRRAFDEALNLPTSSLLETKAWNNFLYDNATRFYDIDRFHMYHVGPVLQLGNEAMHSQQKDGLLTLNITSPVEEFVGLPTFERLTVGKQFI